MSMKRELHKIVREFNHNWGLNLKVRFDYCKAGSAEYETGFSNRGTIRLYPFQTVKCYDQWDRGFLRNSKCVYK